MVTMMRICAKSLRFRKYCVAASTKFTAQKLPHRALVRVAGSEVYDFLQGLITNDVKHLELARGCMYTMFLNTSGRVLFDSIIYKPHKSYNLLIECDRDSVDKFVKHLKMYRLRRRVDIDPDDRDIYVVYNTAVIQNVITRERSVTDGIIFPCDQLNADAISKSSKAYKDLLVYSDPRIPQLGYRVLCPAGMDSRSVLPEVLPVDFTVRDNKDFKWFRYSLGVGEGADDIPLANALPLESNCDYMHGVSFHKGCYIGQELTARTHHTGVVRKRLMPIYFKQVPAKLPENSAISVGGVNVGKLRGISGNVGLALLRVTTALEQEEFPVGDGTAFSLRPSWWPIEMSKEKLSLQKH